MARLLLSGRAVALECSFDVHDAYTDDPASVHDAYTTAANRLLTPRNMAF